MIEGDRSSYQRPLTTCGKPGHNMLPRYNKNPPRRSHSEHGVSMMLDPTLHRPVNQDGSLPYYKPLGSIIRSQSGSNSNSKMNRRRSVISSQCVKPTDALGKQQFCWGDFEVHLKSVDKFPVADSSANKQAYGTKASSAYHKVLKELREKSLKRKAKGFIMEVRLNKLKDAALNMAEEEEEDEDVENDEALHARHERELSKRRRRERVRAHWSTIRRYVEQQIQSKRDKNGAEKAWNILRHQVRVQTRAALVRRELYIKYGVTQGSPTVQPIDRPRLSDSATDLIRTFTSLEIKSI